MSVSAPAPATPGPSGPSGPSGTEPPARPARGPRAAIGVVLLISALVALALWAFAWPAARTGPNGLPVGVAGPPAAAGPLAEQLAGRGGAFDVHRYDDEASARAAIADREVYGAFVTGPGGTALLTASAAGPVVAQTLTQAAGQLAGGNAKVTVTDVVPAPDGDPRGAVFGASVMPLAMAGIATGALLTVLGLRGGRGVVTLLGVAAAAGLAGTAVAHGWLGALGGDWWLVAAALGLVTLAGAATVAGLATLLGPPGIGLGAALLMFLGNPWSGATSAPEMLPDPVGTLGQFLPLGAGVTLIRSVAFFDGAAAAFPVAVLAVWAALGTAAVGLGRGLPRRRAARTAPRDGAAAAQPASGLT